ncbi:zinc ribbon domain-containing protein [Clostridium lacusfryxellense]|uniref:zinc ribbon domain-containing protein n=1 Tax=Clostridium lacusfryxellense TaxID=205328 RepID=UPI001C0D1F7B|nr:zinc ribbon domain-containing protein [Clostridium lacusfryxellense]MBU3110294.1 zinc ribbon domain-containing protein [Clostridium lacusfryxellense]
MNYNYLFSKLIKCYCGANYRGKLERKVPSYICSNYSNYRSCTRRKVKEELLVYHVEKFCKEHDFIFEKNIYFIQDIVEIITVDEEGSTIIKYKNGEEQNIS